MKAAKRDFTALRTVAEADVYKGDVLAASMRRVDGNVEFRYLDDYLADVREPVATTLPLTDAPVITAAGAVPPFFAGLLPEGRRLTALRRAVKASADDDLSLLLAVGSDTVGDVRVVPAGRVPEPEPEALAIGAACDGLDFTALLADAGMVDRAAVAGVQDKVSARMISLPVAQAGRRFILKLTPPEFPAVVENEAYFLRLAAKAGFPVASAELVHDRHGRSGLLVARFDRATAADGSLVRVAVEDAGQLLGLYPADKYNVTMEAVASAVTDACAASAVAAREVFRQVCFAWVTGNGDLHAKNLSVLRHGREWRLSPAYDLPSTLPYQDPSFALALQGRTTGLSRRHLVAFALAIGLPEPMAQRVLDQVLDATAPVIDDWQADVVPLDPRRVRDTVRALRARRRVLER